MATSNYRYESPESTALGNITPTSYDYRDQSKLLSKLVGDTSYMAAYLRKMQKGIDDANQNIAQQIGEMLREAVTIIGGHGDTGFDFGDLKYVLKMIGSFFNLGTDADGNLPLPLNLFDAAWHFFTQYIVNGAHWKELLDETVDNIIAELLSLFGNVPILGQALEALAVFLANLRDVLEAVSSGLHAIFDALGIDIDNLPGWIDYWENLFAPTFNFLHNLFGDLVGDNDILNSIKDFLTNLDAPFVQSIHDAVTWIRTWVSQFSITGGDLAQDIKDYLDGVADFLNQFTITRALSYGLMGFKDTGNMLRNSTLDKDASNWDIDNMGSGASFNPVWNGGVGNVGAGSIEMTGTGTTWVDSEPIVVVPNQKVVLSAYYSKLSTAASDITIEAVELDVNKAVIRTAGATTVHLGTSAPIWTQITNDAAYRVSHDTFYVILRVQSAQPSGGDIFWDDFSYVKDGSIHSFSMPDFGSLVDNIVKTLTGSLTFGHNLSEVPAALQAIPVNFIAGLLSVGGKILSTLFGNFDASVITTGQFASSLFQNLIDAISQGFGGGAGLSLTGLRTFMQALPSIGNLIDGLWQLLTGNNSGSGKSITDLLVAFSSFPATLIAGVLNTLTIPGLDASKIISGALNTSITIFGHAISTLFSSSGILANALTGAISTGVTIVGNAIASLFNGTGLIGTFLNAIDGSKITTGSVAAARIGTLFGNANPSAVLTRTNITDLNNAYVALVDAGNNVGHMSRRSTSSINATANTGNIIFSSYFDTVDSAVGMTGTASTSQFQVQIAGYYKCTICIKIDTSGSNIWRIAPVLFKNGTSVQQGHDAMSYTTVANGASIPRWIKSDFFIQLATNDRVQAGYSADNATGTISTVFDGEATGEQTFFEVSLINPDVP